MARSDRLTLDDQLCFALYAATLSVTRAYRPRLDALGLTYPQYLLLMVLWQDGAMRLADIAARLRLPANAVTGLADGLERAGLVIRRRDSADRRVVHLHLTPEGLALERRAAEAQQQVVCETGLTPAALAALRDSLHALTETMADNAAGTTETVAQSGDDLTSGR